MTISFLFLRFHGKHEPSFFRHLETLDDRAFFQQLRLSRDAFQHIFSLLSQQEQARSPWGRKEEIPLQERLQITLWYLVNKTTFRETSEQFKVSISKTHTAFYSTLKLINRLAKKLIRWPQNLNKTEKGFMDIAGFPGVLGAIDGTHIKICPPATQHNDYLDRTMKHSVTLIAVCDAKKSFTYVSAGYPGSIHDQRCFSMTALGKAVENLPNNFFPRKEFHILGDSAFTLKPGILVPYKDSGSLTRSQTEYNRHHSRTRCVVENSFGFLKNRFRCLMNLEVDFEHVTPIIVACCCLHNVALMFPDFLQEVPDFDVSATDPSVDGLEDLSSNVNAVTKREAISRLFS